MAQRTARALIEERATSEPEARFVLHALEVREGKRAPIVTAAERQAAHLIQHASGSAHLSLTVLVARCSECAGRVQ